MKINKYISLFALLLCVAGCVENKMLKYENDPAIYFAWSSQAREQHDSINHSFFFIEHLKQDTVWVQVNAMGRTEPVNRPISIVQTNGNKPNAAIPGVHYVSFDTPSIREKMIIPANGVNTKIPIVLLQHSSLALQNVRLELAVEGNEYFRPGIDVWRNFLVTTTAQAVKPALWDTNWWRYFGATWGTVKFRFIINATGYTEWDTLPSDMGFLNYLQGVVLQKFQEYNRDNPENPLKEANDELVKF